MSPEKTIPTEGHSVAFGCLARGPQVTLLATPVAPRRAGVGVEQRAARTVAALAERGPVEVTLCRPLWTSLRAVAGDARWSPRLDPLPGELLLRRAALAWPRSTLVANMATAAHRVLPRADRVTTALTRGARLFAGERRARRTPVFHAFHAFRLAAAAALPSPRPARAEIDLDDLESEVARAIAELAQRLGDTAIAAFYRALSERLVALEEAFLPRFDRAYVGSRSDADWLAARMPQLELRVLPNVVDLPALPRAPRAPGPTRFLFVGALAYYPNIDALRVLVDEVLPRLRSLRSTSSFALHVVGRGAPRWLEARLRADPNVVFHGPVAAMAPHLAAADAMVVPLRAGGGTRIKLLEAFAHRVPVIATTIGAFGLDVSDGRELVLADGAEAIAAACARFVDDPEHAEPLAVAAFELVARQHQTPVFAECLQR